MTTTPVRPIAVGDRAEAPMPFGSMIVRGTVAHIAPGNHDIMAIVDVDNGGRVTVPVDTLRPVEQVYLAGGDLAVDADQAVATVAFAGVKHGTGVTVTRDPNGVHITAYDNNRAEGGTEPAVALSFSTSVELLAWLHDQMHNPANDYSRNARRVTSPGGAPYVDTDHYRYGGTTRGDGGF